MYVSLQDIVIDQDGWFSVNSLLSIPVGSYLRIRNRSTVVAKVVRSVTPPNPSSNSGVALGAGDMTGSYLEIPSGSAEVWVRGKGLILTVDVGQDPVPDGLYSGLRAMTVQSYDEANKKNGTQWAASRRVTGVTASQKLYSVIKVGAKPIDLKSRILGGTGAGVLGNIYELFAADIASYGTKDPWYNSRFDLANPAVNQPLTSLYTSTNLTFAGGADPSTFATAARQRGETLMVETNAQNQGKGILPIPSGGNRIIYPNKIALLEIISLDAQNVNARLEIYEGVLDLPL